MMRSSIKIFVLSVAILYAQLSISETIMQLPLADESELEVQLYPATGNELVIILPSGHGITTGLKSLALQLQRSGVESWIADPFTSWLLPELDSSLNSIPHDAYAELINHAQKTGKKIYLLANDKAAKVLLNAAHQWQLKFKGLISGVVLISPDLYMQTPAAGSEARLMPIAYASNLPVFMIVPSMSTLALRVNETVAALQQGGSDVFVQRLNDVRNRFFFREDASNKEVKTAASLSQYVMQSFVLTRSYAKTRSAPALSALILKEAKKTGKLRLYKGSLATENFALNDVNNKMHSLEQYRGKVVLINFWASWCPPCVHEMPSMSLLNNNYSADVFSILAINLGESPVEIAAFLKSHPVNFSVLLDPLKSLPKQWKVFAFPTSYLLDRKGQIRYSIAGGLDWQSAEVKKIVDELVREDFSNR